jgi:hypothetical protein
MEFLMNLIFLAIKTLAEIAKLRALASTVPEGVLLGLSYEYREVNQIGEAMLLEGVPTREINQQMIAMVTEKLVRPQKIVGYEPIQRIPGY